LTFELEPFALFRGEVESKGIILSGFYFCAIALLTLALAFGGGADGTGGGVI
jgi:hypothetical protein